MTEANYNRKSTLYDSIWYGEDIAPITLTKGPYYIRGTFVPIANAASRRDIE